MPSEHEIVELLAALCRLPSVNPEGRDLPTLVTPYGEERVAAYVERYFAALGLEVERQTVHAGRDNVIVRLPGGTPNARPICLEAHMDTVGPEGMAEPFAPRIEHGRLYARGACDTKGSLAAMMLAVARLARLGTKPALPVWLVAAADEEVGQGGVRKLVGEHRNFAGAIVGEPTSLRVVPAHKGQFYLRIHTQGKAAHSSAPHHGLNAIYAMAEVVAVLRRRSERHYPERRHPLCGSPVLTVSLIQGGISEHIVPDACTIALDRRTIPGETTASAVAEIRRWLEEDLGAEAVRRIDLVAPHHDAPAMETAPEHALVRGLRQAVEHTLGRAEISGAPYNTDAGAFAAAGVPVVVFGPGDIAQAHAAVEYVEIDELVAASDSLERLLRDGLETLASGCSKG
jgi:succinyl-diaminopimelate desuccinylase